MAQDAGREMDRGQSVVALGWAGQFRQLEAG